MILITAGIIGCYMSAGLRKRLMLLKAVNAMLEEISILIRYKAATVFEITEAIGKDNRFSELGFISGIKDTCTEPSAFSLRWEEAVMSYNFGSIKPQDLLFISSIGQNLGSSDIEGQLSTLALKKEELKALLAEAESDCKNKSKLYSSLGILTGAFITVLLV